ncbi:hypothetical protein Tco_1072497 [Tanacetum coccineum]
MAQLKYCDKHNQVGFLRKPDESAGFAEITATANTLADGTLELQATIDTIVYTITEASIRHKLQLADASGITMLPNNEIFEGMRHMGYPTDGSFTFWKRFFTPQWRFLVHHILHCISSKSGGWDQFGSNIATALICLSTGRVYNFSKLIFDGMVANLKSKTKFLMYPRFLQLILEIQTENKHPYLAVTLTKKIFGNMKRGFRGAPRPLLPAMLLNNPTTSYLPLYPASTPIPSLDNRPLNYGAHFEEPFPAHTNTSHPQEHAKGTDELWTDLLQKVKKLEGEEQVEDISPTTLEAAKTLSRVASQKPKSIDKGRRYKRRKETKGKKVVTSLDFQEEVNIGYAGGVNTGSIKVSTVSGQVSTISGQVSTDSIKKSIPSPDKGQREGKDPMIIKEAPKKKLLRRLRNKFYRRKLV